MLSVGKKDFQTTDFVVYWYIQLRKKRDVENRAMDTCVISCGTIRREVEKAYRDTGVSYPIFWLESGLHNWPEDLRAALQDKLREAKGYSRVLLAMGFCGNAICGLRAEDGELVIPRVDDCISLLLGSVARRMELVKGCGTYFLTEGWLHGEQSLWWEYQYTVKKYGERRGKAVMRYMLQHYKRLGIIDSGAYPLEEILDETQKVADTLGLRREVLPGDDSFLRRIFSGPWDEKHFLILPPHTEIQSKHLSTVY